MWKTEQFGEVGDCGIRDGGAHQPERDADTEPAEESR
jgi:hypothetical protein